jgi:hypothetical protein
VEVSRERILSGSRRDLSLRIVTSAIGRRDANKLIISGGGGLFRAVETPGNEDEVGVVGAATAEQVRGLSEAEDVVAGRTKKVRSRFPEEPEDERYQESGESEGAHEWRHA